MGKASISLATIMNVQEAQSEMIRVSKEIRKKIPLKRFNERVAVCICVCVFKRKTIGKPLNAATLIRVVCFIRAGHSRGQMRIQFNFGVLGVCHSFHLPGGLLLLCLFHYRSISLELIAVGGGGVGDKTNELIRFWQT